MRPEAVPKKSRHSRNVLSRSGSDQALSVVSGLFSKTPSFWMVAEAVLCVLRGDMPVRLLTHCRTQRRRYPNTGRSPPA
jgi:hypothetical protein